MAVYSVHLQGEGASGVAEAAFIRESFAWDAFLTGPFWLLRRQLWLAAALWIAAFFALVIFSGLGVLSLAASWTIVLLLQILFGLEANRLLERKLVRHGYHLVEVIAAPALDQAEFAFFRHFEAPAPLEPRATRTGTGSRQDVLGVFPDPGPRR
ncbi:DUF2628 domain-containing protein [Methylocapsa polymorpha]|uniref:DUF2628 domain-containing protein n=1 Tax=Methylocapsa polymorpha TaxID=3080828 RepID=A0ABZ0HX60_9HYPH|nr:DUF2628 domain-containing protein [Methylocapsa sp. RX1]